MHREFRSRLHAWATSEGWCDPIRPFGQTILAVRDGRGEVLCCLYVAVDAQGHQFWGLSENTIQNVAGYSPWAAVLLSGSVEQGYCVPGEEILQSIAAGQLSSQRQPGGLSYKLRPYYLRAQHKFGSFNELCGRI
jgi:hypothetical protein